MRIRQAHPSDIKQIARVHVDTWRTTYKGIISDDYLESLSYEKREQNWRDVFSGNVDHNGRVFVAEDHKLGVIGFSDGGPIREKDDVYQGELYCMYILRDFQGKGIGTGLFQKVIEYLKDSEIENMLVWVLEDNPSTRFYENLGGKKVREKKYPIGGIEYKEIAYGWDNIA
jgi:GNAT superfamily N-acetyltransferase